MNHKPALMTVYRIHSASAYGKDQNFSEHTINALAAMNIIDYTHSEEIRTENHLITVLHYRRAQAHAL